MGMLVRMGSKNIHSLLVKMQNGAAPLEGSLAGFFFFLIKLNILSSYDPDFILLVTNQKEMKIYVHAKSCMWMFIAALFIMAKTWEHPKCPSVGEWTNKLRYIQRMENYSMLKRTET